MIQRGDSMSFLLKSGALTLLQTLDGDDAIEACVTGFPYFAHASRAKRREQNVGAELESRRPSHHCH